MKSWRLQDSAGNKVAILKMENAKIGDKFVLPRPGPMKKVDIVEVTGVNEKMNVATVKVVDLRKD